MSDAPFQVTGHSASQAANRFGSAPSDPSAPTLGTPAPGATGQARSAAPSETVVAAPVTIARGDGIGPEIMDAVLLMLDAAGAQLDLHEIEIGEQVYRRGVTAGIERASWDTLLNTRVFLKAPITTPQGGGYKSLNVTARKTLGLFANVRPCRAYDPYVPSRHPGMDVVIVRENEEDTYGGIEHRQTPEVTQCLKLITTPGSEKVIRYAFEYARAHGRRKVTCFTKDNIMKITDGLFHRLFEQIGGQYPELEREHRIIDIGTAQMANDPARFDVVVTPNLYGDIVSDVAAEVAGSVGMVGSANIGTQCAMFEAIHGSAPDIAGQNIANPSGLLHAAVMMLDHVGQGEVAARLENAWLRTVEDGFVTADMARMGENPRHIIGTHAFARAVADRLGREPRTLPAAKPRTRKPVSPHQPAPRPRPRKALVGVDVFLDWDQAHRDPNVLGASLSALAGEEFTLKMITNRGVKVWPEGLPETFCTDHWRCRFLPAGDNASVSHAAILALLARINAAGLDFIKTEHLYTFDGERGYTLGQGE
jgi:isocitrate dehydrogenase